MEASFSVLPLLWPLSEVKVTQLCPILCDPIDYTVHGLLQVRILNLSHPVNNIFVIRLQSIGSDTTDHLCAQNQPGRKKT